MQLSFIVPGKPVAKGRPRFARRGAFVSTYTPEKTASYENLVALSANLAMNGNGPTEKACKVEIKLQVEVPKSWSKKKTTDALEGRILPVSKPDADNTCKGIFDAMNGIVWRDDSQVVDMTVSKRYSAVPQAIIHVSTVE